MDNIAQHKKAPTLHDHLTDLAKALKGQSLKVKWTEVVAVVDEFGLSEAHQKEAQKNGLKKAAKWAIKVATVPDEQASLLDEWREGSLLDFEGARVARATASIELYNWKIKEVTKSIGRFMRTRDQLTRERDALIQSLKMEV